MEIADTFRDSVLAENKHNQNPSELSRLVIDNLKRKLNYEVEKWEKEWILFGENREQMDIRLKKILRFAFPLTINEEKTERLCDFYFSCNHNK